MGGLIKTGGQICTSGMKHLMPTILPQETVRYVIHFSLIGYEGVCRPDHVPTMEGDSNDRPSYSSIGRLFAIGYVKGLREAVYGD